jgi:hypothetical protein
VKHPLFVFALGFATYWGMQHFLGIGNTGRRTPITRG